MWPTPPGGGEKPDAVAGVSGVSPYSARCHNNCELGVSVDEPAPSGDSPTVHRKRSEGERSREIASPSPSDAHASGGGETTTRATAAFERELDPELPAVDEHGCVSRLKCVDGHESAAGVYRLLHAEEGWGHE